MEQQYVQIWYSFKWKVGMCFTVSFPVHTTRNYDVQLWLYRCLFYGLGGTNKPNSLSHAVCVCVCVECEDDDGELDKLSFFFFYSFILIFICCWCIFCLICEMNWFIFSCSNFSYFMYSFFVAKCNIYISCLYFRQLMVLFSTKTLNIHLFNES